MGIPVLRAPAANTNTTGMILKYKDVFMFIQKSSIKRLNHIEKKSSMTSAIRQVSFNFKMLLYTEAEIYLYTFSCVCVHAPKS